MLIGAMMENIEAKNLLRGRTSFNNDKIVCCWTAVGNGDRFSAMIRSIKFTEAYKFYEKHKHHRRNSLILVIGSHVRKFLKI